jgi:polysaccharide export outer membrane protein
MGRAKIMRRALWYALPAIMLALATGCAGVKARIRPATAAPQAAAPGSSAPDQANPGDDPANPKTYVIGIQDILMVQVWGEPDFPVNLAYLVRPDGRITVLKVGEVAAAGRTPDQLGKDIAELLVKAGMKEPEVNVSLQQSHSRQYFIEGEVKLPGRHDLTTSINVLQALVESGGFLEFADKKHIIINRGNGAKILKFNYNDVIKGKHTEQNIFLEPGDVIVVN